MTSRVRVLATNNLETDDQSTSQSSITAFTELGKQLTVAAILRFRLVVAASARIRKTKRENRCSSGG
jgi:hypothetical protein